MMAHLPPIRRSVTYRLTYSGAPLAFTAAHVGYGRAEVTIAGDPPLQAAALETIRRDGPLLANMAIELGVETAQISSAIAERLTS